MLRRIIEIDEEKCIGCGKCVIACHEGAIQLVNGKAKLVKENHCDGLGDCLPNCPADAIQFIERETVEYDEQAVKDYKKETGSHLMAWPVQLKLAPIRADFFRKANLLIAADCTAYAYGDFHRVFMDNRVTLIGCSKLDGINYTTKLSQILTLNDIQTITFVRMEVPCCSGLERMLEAALIESGKNLPIKKCIITIQGEIIQ
ncbi:MAG: 4Fe-4S binding protein [Holdemanella sp.]|nr:4Fe-4S binding protein [Holdemanella sp.]